MGALAPLLDMGQGICGLWVRRSGTGKLEIMARVHRFGNGGAARPAKTWPDRVADVESVLEAGTADYDVVQRLWAEAAGAAAAGHTERLLLDPVTLVVIDGPGEALVVRPAGELPGRLFANLSIGLDQILRHLSAGWRLLRRLVGSSGASVGSEEFDTRPDARAVLRKAVCASERLPESPWSGSKMVAMRLLEGVARGECSLVDRFDADGRDYVVVYRNAATLTDPRRLTCRERRCAEKAARGAANAEIAWDLGLSESTASTLVQSAMHKVGIIHRHHLGEIFDPSPRTEPRAVSLAHIDERLSAVSIQSGGVVQEMALSRSERQVVLALLGGASNREIARARGTSDRTVANQIQSIYRKLGVRSRSELGAALRWGAAVSCRACGVAVDRIGPAG